MYPNTRRSAFVALALVLLISPPSPAPAQSLCNPPEEGSLPGFATQVYDAIQDSLDFLRRQHALNLVLRKNASQVLDRCQSLLLPLRVSLLDHASDSAIDSSFSPTSPLVPLSS